MSWIALHSDGTLRLSEEPTSTSGLSSVAILTIVLGRCERFEKAIKTLDSQPLQANQQATVRLEQAREAIGEASSGAPSKMKKKGTNPHDP